MENSVEKEYQLYLEKCRLDESKMHPVQRVETRRAFFAGFGQCLVELGELSKKHNEAEFFEIVEAMKEEVIGFWQAERAQYESKNPNTKS